MPSGYKKNYQNHGVSIPPFLGVDAGLTDVTFGGFEMDKFINSQPSAINEQGLAWYDVAHNGAAGSVLGISKPGDPVWDYITFPQAMIAAANKGKGYFLSTDVMWASIAFLAKKQGTLPHGNNNNLNPPSATGFTTEIATLDKHLKAESPTNNRALPGSGPAAWAHNHLASGVYDLNGLVYEWVCLMMDTNGYPQISANLNLSYGGSPFGRGTVSATELLTADGAGVNWKKEWETWLKYDAEEGAIAVNDVVVGGTSTASGIVMQVIDLGTTGLLRLRRTTTAAFQNDEDLKVATVKKAVANGTEIGEFAITYLGYDGQTVAFALGDTVTGATTTHNGIIVSDSDCGTFGTLGILGATGVFQDDEELQVGGATKALAVGTAQSCQAYIPEASAGAGASYPITASSPNTLTLSGTPANGVATFWINKTITRDITLRTDTGLAMTSGHKIDSLRDADNDLKPFAIPGTSNAEGSASYGNAYYYFNKSAARAAIRGGGFGGGGGVFTLYVVNLPADAYYYIGFRGVKVL